MNSIKLLDMHQLTFTLRQHTPILHFQHDQPGATLRATEVKPKLDRFIIRTLQKVDPELFEKYKTVITADNFPLKDKVASPYKLSIKAKGSKNLIVKTYFSRREQDEISETERCEGSYFGEAHKGVYSENVTIQIFSFDPQIRELVFESLKWLFLLENFGCRVTKGFGSFTWEGFTETDIEERLKKAAPLYLKIYSANNTGNFKTALSNIHEKYQTLKSGRNVPGTYEKSRLFQFMCRADVGWEKRWIKLGLTEDDISDTHLILYNKRPLRCGDERNEWDDLNNVTYKFIRALLGLSDKHEYLLDDGNRRAIRDEKLVVRIEPLSKDIERFASPLTFRVIQNKIFILVNPIHQDLFGKAFKFSAWHKAGRSEPRHLKNLGEKNVPLESEFDLVAFLDKSLPQLGFKPI